eukprot:5969840-Pyramimonas_sp.AAC.1
MLSLPRPCWGQDRDLASAVILDACLKARAHRRLNTRVCPKALFHARLQLSVRRCRKVANLFRGVRPLSLIHISEPTRPEPI